MICSTWFDRPLRSRRVIVKDGQWNGDQTGQGRKRSSDDSKSCNPYDRAVNEGRAINKQVDASGFCWIGKKNRVR